MSIACPHRHLSYSQWRLTVYRALFADVAQSPYTTGRGPIVRGYGSSTARKSTEEEKSRPKQPKAHVAAKKGPVPKKWDPYSQQGRNDLWAALQQLQEADFPQPESANQLADLPQSPIINRTLRRRRQRPAKRQPTPEERALENDPWAAMLAQPVRMEIPTRARLPTALMTNWGLVKRPETDDVYVLPDSLANLDSLDKMDKMDAQQPCQERAERAEPQAAAAVRATEKQSKHSALLNPRTNPAIRLLPSAKLMDRLTQLYTFVERPSSPSSPRIMRLSVDLTSILPQLWRERIARVRHYDWSHREVEAKTGNRDLKPLPLEATISKTNLKWQPDIEHRLLSILRTRLAVCLKRVLHLAGTGTGTSTASQSGGERGPIQLQPALLDMLKNRGESHSDATLVVDNEAGFEHPPAHGHEPSRLWGPYSPPRILLYFSDDPADQTLQRLPTTPLTTIPGIKPTTYIDESETAQQKAPSLLLPPLLPLLSTTNPIFPMRALLDEPQYSALVQAIRQSTRDWLPWDDNNQQASSHHQQHILSVSADAACADVLFTEIWRLWRYVGGRQCMAAETV